MAGLLSFLAALAVSAEASSEDRAAELNEVKPHLSMAAAAEAVEQIDELIELAQTMR